jgi:hypothetical protein
MPNSDSLAAAITMRCQFVPVPLSAHPYPFVISMLAKEGQDVPCGAGLDRDIAKLRGGRMNTSKEKLYPASFLKTCVCKFNNHSAVTATKKAHVSHASPSRK